MPCTRVTRAPATAGAQYQLLVDQRRAAALKEEQELARKDCLQRWTQEYMLWRRGEKPKVKPTGAAKVSAHLHASIKYLEKVAGKGGSASASSAGGNSSIAASSTISPSSRALVVASPKSTVSSRSRVMSPIRVKTS